MLKIIIIAIICIFISSCIKTQNQEISNIISICGGVIIFLLCIDKIKEFVEYFSSLYLITNIDFNYLSLILKIIGVGYITEFTADIAEDFNNKIIASKVILGGKVVICVMSLPILKELFVLLLSLLA
ncbi:MAG: stage III sporulation protein AD [Clostridia bacterium]|nr:stage III sporulation protein AD [Clostridia bacterium]